MKAPGERGRGSQLGMELDGCCEAGQAGDGRRRSGGGLLQQEQRRERGRLVVVSLNPYWAKVAYEGGGGGTGCGR